MKRVLIGCTLSFLGTIWGLASILFVGNNLVSSWVTPPGRFLTTVFETGMTVPFTISLLLVIVGFIIMGIEYFKKSG